MNFTQAIESGLANYRDFSGRAVRSEYWFWALFAVIGEFVAGSVDVAIFPYSAVISPLEGVFSLVILLPSLALSVRRLHDIDRSGLWALLLLTGFGFFVLIYWAAIRGTPGPNRFGADPFFDGILIPRPRA
jgi:uncharacterized membrane protein YhaH (DUF805 family)